jgi:hypothetical protein
MECGGLTPLCYGEARLAREEQRLLLLRVLSLRSSFFAACLLLPSLCVLGATAVNDILLSNFKFEWPSQSAHFRTAFF